MGSKVGMMRKSDGTLHFFVNGEDIGPAPVDVPTNIFAVVSSEALATILIIKHLINV